MFIVGALWASLFLVLSWPDILVFAQGICPRKTSKKASLRFPYNATLRSPLSELQGVECTISTRCPGPQREGIIEEVGLMEVAYTLTSHILVLGPVAQASAGSFCRISESPVSPQASWIRISSVCTLKFDVVLPASLPFCAVTNTWSLGSGLWASSLQAGLPGTCLLPFAKGWANSPYALLSSLPPLSALFSLPKSFFFCLVAFVCAPFSA